MADWADDDLQAGLDVGFQSSRSAYVPSPVVESYSGLDGDAEFEIDGEYFWGIVPLPAVYLALGVLSIVIFCLIMCCPCCLCCCDINCSPRTDAPTYTKPNGEVHFAKDKMVFGPFYLFLLATFIASFTVFKGSGTVGKGFKSVQESIEILETDIFGDMVDRAILMREEAVIGYDIARANTEAGCNDMMDAFQTTFAALRDVAEELEESIETVPPALADGRNAVKQLAGLVAFAIFGLFGFYLAICLCYLLLEFFEIKALMKLLITSTVAIELGATFVLAIVLALEMVLGDFCIDPVNTIIALGSDRDSPADQYESLSVDSDGTGTMLLFYLYRNEDGIVCSGKDVVGEVIDDISSALDDITDIFDDYADDDVVQGLCGSDLDDLLYAFDETADALTATVEEASCASINEAFTILVEDGLCSGLATGIGEVWASQFFCTFFLFIVMCAAGVSFHYFGAIEKVVPSGDGDVEMENGSMTNGSGPPSTELVTAVKEEYYNPKTKGEGEGEGEREELY